MVTNEEILSELRYVAGQLAAVQFAVATLIVMYPEQEKLAQAWRLFLTKQIDDFMEEDAYSHPETRNAIHETLAKLGGDLN